jgi:AcrR family transcriptional regulator
LTAAHRAIDASRPAPGPRELAPRAGELAVAARRLLEEEGPDALTMRRLADALTIRAPSIYKHFDGKPAIELVLVEQGLTAMGAALREAIHGRSPADAVGPLLAAYRRTATDRPNLYRLATVGPLPREDLVPDLEDWAGEPFLLVMGEPYLAQVVWSAAHGMVSLEIDGRYPPDTDLDHTWAEARDAFTVLAPC